MLPFGIRSSDSQTLARLATSMGFLKATRVDSTSQGAFSRYLVFEKDDGWNNETSYNISFNENAIRVIEVIT